MKSVRSSRRESPRGACLCWLDKRLVASKEGADQLEEGSQQRGEDIRR